MDQLLPRDRLPKFVNIWTSLVALSLLSCVALLYFAGNSSGWLMPSSIVDLNQTRSAVASFPEGGLPAPSCPPCVASAPAPACPPCVAIAPAPACPPCVCVAGAPAPACTPCKAAELAPLPAAAPCPQPAASDRPSIDGAWEGPEAIEVPPASIFRPLQPGPPLAGAANATKPQLLDNANFVIMIAANYSLRSPWNLGPTLASFQAHRSHDTALILVWHAGTLPAEWPASNATEQEVASNPVLPLIQNVYLQLYDPPELYSELFHGVALNRFFILESFVRNVLATPPQPPPANDSLAEYDRQLNTHWLVLCDARDVVWQEDPFAPYVAHDEGQGMGPGQPIGALHFTTETGEENLWVQKYNRDWFVGCYGMEVFKEVSGHRILNSGYTLGRADAILRYLRVMRREMGRTRWCWKEGNDQALHNKIIYTGQLIREARVLDNEYYVESTTFYGRGGGYVKELQLFSKLAFFLENNEVGLHFTGHRAEGWYKLAGAGSETWVTNLKDKRYVALHQWDRLEDIREMVFKKYAQGGAGA